MTLRELIEVVPRDEYLTLIIKDACYPMQANVINILRLETLDLIVKNIVSSHIDGELALAITLESPEVPSDEIPRGDDKVGIVWGRRNWNLRGGVK